MEKHTLLRKRKGKGFQIEGLALHKLRGMQIHLVGEDTRGREETF